MRFLEDARVLIKSGKHPEALKVLMTESGNLTKFPQIDWQSIIVAALFAWLCRGIFPVQSLIIGLSFHTLDGNLLVKSIDSVP